MASLTHLLSATSAVTLQHARHKQLQLVKTQKVPSRMTFPCMRHKPFSICCSKQSPWEPAPVTYVPSDNIEDKFLEGTTNIFETMSSGKQAEGLTDVKSQPPLQLQYLRWPVWLLGPVILLATGMVPTLWLPISSVFIGPNIASLLSLTGLDCIYNLGANLFLLLADSCARSPDSSQDSTSKPPFGYQLWNMVANVMGLVIPLIVYFASQNSFLQPQLPFISYAVLLGPYLLLLSIQILTEMLTWHWKSPVWLVTPVVYEAYRVLQLMRGLKLSAELNAPSWMLHTIRGLVCWWVLILGMQLMRVAWYAGFTARAHQKQLHALPNAD
uniref:Putative cytochrome P450-like n=1 Tax=Solanum chacoense TaxID=4108 RepID=A0A0V0HZM4_SOLCH